MIRNMLHTIASPLPMLFSTPALVGNTSQIDREGFRRQLYTIKNITSVALFAITAVSFAFLFAGYTALSFVTISVLILVPPMVGLSLLLHGFQTHRESDRRAVHAFVTDGVTPTQSDSNRITNNLRVARELVRQGGAHAVNKPSIENIYGNEEPEYLIERRGAHELNLNYEIFKVLIEGGANLTLRGGAVGASMMENKRMYPLFENFVRCEDVRYLEFILEHGSVTAADFDKADHAHFWQNAQTLRAMELLDQYGFDVNAKDLDGNTPLILRARMIRHFYPEPTSPIMTPEVSLSTLLRFGADPAAVNKDNLNANDVCVTGLKSRYPGSANLEDLIKDIPGDEAIRWENIFGILNSNAAAPSSSNVTT